jgi:hypothetical protein
MNLGQSMNGINARSQVAKIVAGMLLSVGPMIGHADPVLIDFNDAAGVPSFGGTWNTIPASSGTTQLVDAAGAMTNISLSFSSGWFDDIQVSPWSHGNTAWIDANAAKDGLNHDPTAAPGHIALTGLATNLIYRIDLLAAQEFGDQSLGTADFSIFGSFGDSSPNGDNFNVHTDGLVNGNFMTWNAVAPNASGEILIQVAGSTSTNPHMLGDFVSAARITCLDQGVAGGPLQEVSCAANVPEPGTIALLALGLAGFVARRRQGVRAE